MSASSTPPTAASASAATPPVDAAEVAAIPDAAEVAEAPPAVDAAVTVASSDRARRPSPSPRPAPSPKPVPPERPPPTTGPRPICDEVECVLTNYERECCKRYRKPPQPGELPERLDKAAILAGVGKVKGKVKVCGQKFPAQGTVQVRFTVNGAGHVTSAESVASPDPALGECVASVVKTATFAKSRDGGSVKFPFVF